VEPALEMMVATQRLGPVLRSAQNAAGLRSKSADRRARRYLAASCHLMCDAAHGSARNARNGLKQVPRLRVLVKRLGNCPDAFGQLRRAPCECFRNLRKRSLRHRGHRLCNNRKELAGGHPDQRQKMLGGLVFCLRFCRQLAEVFHHGVWIDFANGADLIFVFVLALIFVFAFAQQAAGDVAKGAEPAFAFKACLILHLVFHFAFHLVLELFFELGFKFRQGFQLIFRLECHDESSCVVDRACLETS
jgi:hypothetical protein